MNCPTCGIEYSDTPHPSAVCARHAGAELAKARKALDGCLDAIRKLTVARRGFQIMARQMVLCQDPGFYLAAMDEGNYMRAGGDVECAQCRLPYVEHPELPRFPTFHVLCSGEIVKT